MSADERDARWSTLSATEHEQAGRFRFEADRDRFIAARGGLRAILSAYVGAPAAQLAFQTNSHGKPSLSEPGTPIDFNLSHSGECVLIGISRDGPCGVDIESSRPGRAEHEIAERFFCPRELTWLKHTAGGFFRLWTAKEAVIKAVGHGLSIPLSDVDVTDVLDGTASSLVLETPGIEPRTIWLTELTLVAGYASAVAVDQGPAVSELRSLSRVEGVRH